MKFFSYHPEIAETIRSSKFSSLIQQTRFLARMKAKKAQEEFPDSLILAADTLVGLKGKILGKPESEKQAFQMLRTLNGNEHEVVTTVALLKNTQAAIRSVVTKVWFYKKPPSFLKWYLSTGEYKDKAGAYGIQGHGSLLVKKIEGDYYNVVGLPVGVLWEMLEKFKKK